MMAIYDQRAVTLTIAHDDSYGIGSPGSSLVTIVSNDLPSIDRDRSDGPARGGADADVIVSDTTKNQERRPRQQRQTGFYLSANTILDANRHVPWQPCGSVARRCDAYGVEHASHSSIDRRGLLLRDRQSRLGWRGDRERRNEQRACERVIKIGPDLIVSAITVPAGAAAGGTFVVTDATKNQGGGTAATTMTRFYLSTDSILDAADVGLGNRSVPLLLAGASDQVNRR
jgi:hypothetical protein